jgi:secreted PhoX family phosphatase
MKKHNNVPANGSANQHFAEVCNEALSRRSFVQAGIGTLAVGFFAAPLSQKCAAGAVEEAGALLTFRGVPVSREDKVLVPEGYRAQVLYRWGDPIDGQSPKFDPAAKNSWGDQERQAGMGHDGMQWFPLPGDSRDRADRGLLAMNHEYADQGLLFEDGIAGPMTREKVLKSQAAHGVSIIAVERDAAGAWHVKPSPFTRRITARTPMQLAGPAAGSKWTITHDDPTGTQALGTFNNCASGLTPWGTYLTCEENFHGVFGTNQIGFRPNTHQRRYGLSPGGFAGLDTTGQPVSVYRWWEHDERFDLAKQPNESNRFGYVVEIDPADPEAMPRKHTALGRFKHENAAVTLSKDGRVVVYMGDDERNEYIYKFVSQPRFLKSNRAGHRDLLDLGTLYVARFDADHTGRWIELTHGQNGLTDDNGFESQAEICVRTRQAADLVGATMMDRPEWVAVHPHTGDVYVTLTNNDRRGALPPSRNNPDGTTAASSAQPRVDRANPRAPNIYGQILRWTEEGGDAAATSFQWDHFLLAGDPAKDRRVSIKGDLFGSPDGLWFDPRGILWIQTDASASIMSHPVYENLGNNMMLAANPATGEVRRFLVGPKACEVTGVAMTPDHKTMFVNIQHPGEPVTDITDPKNPTAISNWPDGRAAGRPRSATVVISRTDGGAIGS